MPQWVCETSRCIVFPSDVIMHRGLKRIYEKSPKIKTFLHNQMLNHIKKVCLKSAASSHLTPKLHPREEIDASQQGRMGWDRQDDNTRRPTSEPKQCGTERGGCTERFRAALEAHPR